MNIISLVGCVVGVPATFDLEDNLRYTSFQLRVRGSYVDHNGDSHDYSDEHTIICLDRLADFVQSIPSQEDIEVVGELRNRTYGMFVGGDLTMTVSYQRSEIVAGTITFREVVVGRTEPDDVLIALYRPDPA